MKKSKKQKKSSENNNNKDSSKEKPAEKEIKSQENTNILNNFYMAPRMKTDVLKEINDDYKRLNPNPDEYDVIHDEKIKSENGIIEGTDKENTNLFKINRQRLNQAYQEEDSNCCNVFLIISFSVLFVSCLIYLLKDTFKLNFDYK